MPLKATEKEQDTSGVRRSERKMWGRDFIMVYVGKNGWVRESRLKDWLFCIILGVLGYKICPKLTLVWLGQGNNDLECGNPIKEVNWRHELSIRWFAYRHPPRWVVNWSRNWLTLGEAVLQGQQSPKMLKLKEARKQESGREGVRERGRERERKEENVVFFF